MTNYEKLRSEYFKDAKFVKAYKQATIERNISEALEELEIKIEAEKPPLKKIIKMLEMFRTNIYQGKYAKFI